VYLANLASEWIGLIEWWVGTCRYICQLTVIHLAMATSQRWDTNQNNSLTNVGGLKSMYNIINIYSEINFIRGYHKKGFKS